jgi:predicted DCC family thiol-disulfide oxidoreductase YuxK
MRARVEPRDRDGRVRWLDFRDPEVQRRAEPITVEQLDAEMHARTEDGRWFSGYAAWLEVLRVLPGWRRLVPVLSRWPFTSLGPLFYRWLATRRYKLFGIPPPCGPDGVCSLES